MGIEVRVMLNALLRIVSTVRYAVDLGYAHGRRTSVNLFRSLVLPRVNLGNIVWASFECQNLVPAVDVSKSLTLPIDITSRLSRKNSLTSSLAYLRSDYNVRCQDIRSTARLKAFSPILLSVESISPAMNEEQRDDWCHRTHGRDRNTEVLRSPISPTPLGASSVTCFSITSVEHVLSAIR